MQVLPGGRQDQQTKLESVETELGELTKLHEQLERDAHRVSNRFMFVGFVVLATQFAAFIRLTYWELSWDVMEPIAYMISLFYSLLAYTYFLATRGAVFDLQPFKDYWFERLKVRVSAGGRGRALGQQSPLLGRSGPSLALCVLCGMPRAGGTVPGPAALWKLWRHAHSGLRDRGLRRRSSCYQQCVPAAFL